MWAEASDPTKIAASMASPPTIMMTCLPMALASFWRDAFGR
jgi:hypothetical protein